MNLELEIYEHILNLIKNAEDLRELEKWVTRERGTLSERIYHLELS